jgi:parallel beta-helix repeat protein
VVKSAPCSTVVLLAFGALLTGGALAGVQAQSTVAFRPGMRVTESVRVRPGTYETPAPSSPDEALIIVAGQGITLDLSGVVLRGLTVEADPDLATGVAVRVDGGSEVTIVGGTIRGYRFGILARGTRNLSIRGTDLSYNWKPRLFSQVGQESLVDWLSFHNNEADEWMRFGAAIYLEGVRGGDVTGARAVQGMNGLLMVGTDSVRIQGNDFSYSSGLGIGLYRSSWNEIVRNRLDYDVRGYSEGLYQRGQDSAGLLVYEQSSHNIVAYNSATHSGDGFFLWAGQQTMDTGEGGANDNLLFFNDFSFAPTNAVEVTFSRNRVIGNYLRGSRYGVWGGYSWESEFRGNCFGGNQYGIAIEHGQDNVIESNRFDGDSLVISLWSRASEPADWAYAQRKDTYSRNQRVGGNTFAANAELWQLERTRGNDISANTILRTIPSDACDPRLLLGDEFAALQALLPDVPPTIPTHPRTALPRSAMVVDSWGPHDGLSPKLWPVDTASAAVRLRVLGPAGSWRIVERQGLASVSATRGLVGDTLVVSPADGRAGDWAVTLEYVGGPTVSPRGTTRPADEPYLFGYERFDPTGEWDIRLYAWTDEASDPDGSQDGLAPVFAGTPFMERRERLDYQWFTPRIQGVPRERWAAEASARVTLPAGEYSLRTISDGGVRVWVDGTLVIDHWDAHGAEVDYAPISPGSHDIRVRYFQLTGWTEIRAEVIRGSSRSPGSAGPH